MWQEWKYASWVTLRPQSDRCCRGEAEVRILDFKTTWSEFQKPYQTAAVRGEAELRIYNLKKTSPTQSRSQAVVCVSTPRMYPRSRVRVSKGLSDCCCARRSRATYTQFWNHLVRLLLSEAKLSQVYSILKPHGQNFRNSTVAPNSIPCGFRIE